MRVCALVFSHQGFQAGLGQERQQCPASGSADFGQLALHLAAVILQCSYMPQYANTSRQLQSAHNPKSWKITIPINPKP